MKRTLVVLMLALAVLTLAVPMASAQAPAPKSFTVYFLLNSFIALLVSLKVSLIITPDQKGEIVRIL